MLILLITLLARMQGGQGQGKPGQPGAQGQPQGGASPGVPSGSPMGLLAALGGGGQQNGGTPALQGFQGASSASRNPNQGGFSGNPGEMGAPGMGALLQALMPQLSGLMR
jgi:hypothetical protein